MPITPDWPYSQPPWVVLGVAQIATVDEIKEAHRTLSKQCHPDKGGSADQQVQINKARDEMLKARPV